MIDLVLQPDEITSASSIYTEHIYKKHFNLVMWDSGKTYDKKNTVFLFYYNLEDLIKFNLINQLRSEGYKVVLDQLHDFNNLDHAMSDKLLRLRLSDWFWINEFYINSAHGLNQYTPNNNFSKKAFMPMHNASTWRTKVFKLFSDQHSDMIYSYKKNPELPLSGNSDYLWDRQFNPVWYNDTCISVVVETQIQYPSNFHDTVFFVTEKTWKPIAFSHPFIFIAEIGMIQYLHSRGFETYDNLFDESYDSMEDHYSRIHNVHQQVSDFEKRPYNKLTLEKIDFNRNLFYNQQRVDKITQEQIIDPILEYAET